MPRPDAQEPESAEVIELALEPSSPAALVAGLVARDPRAGRLLCARFGATINRLVARLLGPDQEHDDVVHQIYANVLAGVASVREPALFDRWVTRVAILTVRREIRARTYRRLLRFGVSEPEPADEKTTPQRMLLRSFYAVLGKLAADERIIFVLHHVEGRTLPEVAELRGCSLATAKRHLARARAAFEVAARLDPVLSAAVEGGHHEP